MSQVWERTDLSQSETLVALALADHADDSSGECWPSIDRIAEKARLKRRATQNVIQRLEEIGLITVERAVGRRNTNCYTFHMEQKGAANAPLLESVKGASPYREKVHPGTEKVHLDDIKGAAAAAPESSITIKEPSEEEPPGLDPEAWVRYFKYRTAIRKTIKPASVLAAQRKLAGFESDQAAVVEQSVANGWQGLFALKGGPTPQRERRPITRYEQMQEDLARASEG